MKELCDYLTGNRFSKDTATIDDISGSEYLLIHELVEIGELKRMGRNIHRNTMMQSPRKKISMAHSAALEQELNYAIRRRELPNSVSRLNDSTSILAPARRILTKLLVQCYRV